ncbi:hypothetical protein [uncultured Dokdonia sp.]|uniref:hypothetical protein n=1 Tax=uncultured Dokdonia sp. TaxID=575653 RepID=UPI00262B34E8|nr:hypothetical protein [uncultured Dokdonia sp.]
MKIAMIGPGYGHNIKPFLDYFETDISHSLDFYYHTNDFLIEKYEKINFFSTPKRINYLLKHIKSYDVIWLMGGGRLMYLLYFILLFKKKKSHAILHIWSEDLPRSIMQKSFMGIFKKIMVSNFTIINCNWFGTANIFKGKIKNKVQVNALGMVNDYFLDIDSPDRDLKKILDKIDNNTYNFYYPKSFTKSSRHDLVIEAANILKEKNKLNFKIYFWEGNVVDIAFKKNVLNLIDKYDLSSYVILLKKDKFYSTEEFNLLWGKMDCGLQIAEYDQISNTVFEPLINEKDIIISDIEPYRYLEHYFGFKLVLTPLKTKDIAIRMEGMITGKMRTDIKEKSDIKKSILEKYRFETNFNSNLKKLEKDL